MAGGSRRRWQGNNALPPSLGPQRPAATLVGGARAAPAHKICCLRNVDFAHLELDLRLGARPTVVTCTRHYGLYR